MSVQALDLIQRVGPSISEAGSVRRFSRPRPDLRHPVRFEPKRARGDGVIGRARRGLAAARPEQPVEDSSRAR